MVFGFVFDGEQYSLNKATISRCFNSFAWSSDAVVKIPGRLPEFCPNICQFFNPSQFSPLVLVLNMTYSKLRSIIKNTMNDKMVNS